MELSLSAIDVLNTRDVIVLQALTLYLVWSTQLDWKMGHSDTSRYVAVLI